VTVCCGVYSQTHWTASGGALHWRDIPEAKRPVRSASARSAEQQAPAAAAAAAAAAVKPDETWEDIVERTGMTVEDLWNKKLAFKKGTLPAKKLEEMGPVIKELKCVLLQLHNVLCIQHLHAQPWQRMHMCIDADAHIGTTSVSPMENNGAKKTQLEDVINSHTCPLLHLAPVLHVLHLQDTTIALNSCLDHACCRALGWFLLTGKGRSDMDAKQWEQDALEKQQRISELEQEFSNAQNVLQQQIVAAKVCSHSIARPIAVCARSDAAGALIHSAGAAAVLRRQACAACITFEDMWLPVHATACRLRCRKQRHVLQNYSSKWLARRPSAAASQRK